MDVKRSLPLFQNIKNLFTHGYQLIGDIKHLASLEAKLTRRSLVKLVFLFVLLFGLAISTWACFNVLGFFALIYYDYSNLMAMSIVTVVNLLFLLAVVILMIQTKSNIGFRATKRQVGHTKNLLRGP